MECPCPMAEESRLPPVALNGSTLPQNLLGQDRLGGNTLSLCKGIASVTPLTCASCCPSCVVHDCLLAVLPWLSAALRAGPASPQGFLLQAVKKVELSQWVQVTPKHGCSLFGDRLSPLPGLSADVPLSLTKRLSIPSWCVTWGPSSDPWQRPVQLGGLCVPPVLSVALWGAHPHHLRAPRGPSPSPKGPCGASPTPHSPLGGPAGTRHLPRCPFKSLFVS